MVWKFFVLSFSYCILCLHFYMMLQKTKKQNATTGLRTCNNILTMTKVTGMQLFLYQMSSRIHDFFIYIFNHLIYVASHYMLECPPLLEISESTFHGKRQQNLHHLPHQLLGIVPFSVLLKIIFHSLSLVSVLYYLFY